MTSTNLPAQLVDLSSGAPAQLVAITLSMAWKYFFFLALVSFIVEAFGKSPTEPRDYAACTWRAVIVMVLLASYQQLFGSLVNFAAQLAADVAPAPIANQLGGSLVSSAQSFWSVASAGVGATTATSISSAATSSLVGDMFFKALIGFVTVLGLIANRIIMWLAGVLIALCYVLGPLALVFSIPRVSSVGVKWFEHFVSICTWPIISGVLVCLVGALGVQVSGDAGQSLNSLAMSLVLLCTAIATPVLAGKFVGGGMAHAVSHGFSTASGLAGGVKSLAEKATSNRGDSPSPHGGGAGPSSNQGPTNAPAPAGGLP